MEITVSGIVRPQGHNSFRKTSRVQFYFGLGAEECRREYGAPNLMSWIVGNLMTEVVNLEPDLPSLSMFILLKNHQFTNLILFYMLDVAI